MTSTFTIALFLFIGVTLVLFHARISRFFEGVGWSIALYLAEREASKTAHIDCARAALKAAAPKPNSVDIVA